MKLRNRKQNIQGKQMNPYLPDCCTKRVKSLNMKGKCMLTSTLRKNT